MGDRGPKTAVDLGKAKRLREEGWTNKQIGEYFGVSGQNIGKLLGPKKKKKKSETVSQPPDETVSQPDETVSPTPETIANLEQYVQALVKDTVKAQLSEAMDPRIAELEQQLGTSPGMVDAHNRLNAVNRLQLETDERLDALEVAKDSLHHFGILIPDCPKCGGHGHPDGPVVRDGRQGKKHQGEVQDFLDRRPYNYWCRPSKGGCGHRGTWGRSW